MVYIDRDGRVLERRPWNLSRIAAVFMGLWFMAVTFFSTLLAPFRRNDGNRSRSSDRNSRWSGSDGGAGGHGGDGGNGGPRNRRIGRLNTSAEMNCPTGGCGCG